MYTREDIFDCNQVEAQEIALDLLATINKIKHCVEYYDERQGCVPFREVIGSFVEAECQIN